MNRPFDSLHKLPRPISFTTTRRDGHVRLPGALERVLRARKLPASPATAEQIHGVRVEVVPALAKSRTYPNADGLVTDVSNQPLGIYTADCLPVFLSASRAGVVGVIHAGWRGLQGGILKKTVQLLRQKWNVRPSEIEVWSGPAIGGCCFQVQWDVAKYFPGARKRSKDRWTVDLQAALRRQAQALGVDFRRTPASRRCTMHGRRYFSYRRDATVDRQVSVIMKRGF